MPGETWWPILDIPARAGALFKGEPIKGLRDWDTAVVSIKSTSVSTLMSVHVDLE